MQNNAPHPPSCPSPPNLYVALNGKGELRLLTDLKNRKIILHNPGEPNAITWAPNSGTGRQERGGREKVREMHCEEDSALQKEEGGNKPRHAGRL